MKGGKKMKIKKKPKDWCPYENILSPVPKSKNCKTCKFVK